MLHAIRLAPTTMDSGRPKTRFGEAAADPGADRLRVSGLAGEARIERSFSLGGGPGRAGEHLSWGPRVGIPGRKVDGEFEA